MAVFDGIDSFYGLVIGASQGIGLEFVRQLLNKPVTQFVFATYRHTPSAELADLAAQFPDRLLLLSVDVTDEAQIAAAIAEIKCQTQRLHFVIYCVGVLHAGDLQPEKSLQQLQSENLLRYFQVNSIGVVLFAKHLVPLLKHGDRSVLASISAKVGSIGDNEIGGWYGYRASKAALNMFMRTTAIEYRRKSPNTLIVLLHPGTTDTRLSKPFQRGVPPEKLFPVERTVTQLLSVIDNLQAEDSGQFFSWNGDRLPW